ncbi:MAG: hypothetical protein LBH12_05280, partial [Dysgonamonadaceae bacterium]|nr:hypothetical protein [Dysgonamonadaceae bacterium]
NEGANELIVDENATPGQKAKAQMAYDTGGYAADPEVFGGLLQWGRKMDGHEDRESTTTSSKPADPANAGNQFVTSSSNWLSSPIDDLWGNGGGLLTQANTTYTGSQNVNNPCPDGYRVPTQHEWALLGHDAGGSGEEWDDYFYTDLDENSTVVDNAATPQNNPDITWVRVSEGRAAAPDTWIDDGETRGYALYDSTVWTNADPGYRNGTDLLSDAAAPDPLLFLPAGGTRIYFDDGDVGYTGSSGYYWSSVVDGTNSYFMFFNSVGVDAGNSAADRAFGMSVRCIAE